MPPHPPAPVAGTRHQARLAARGERKVLGAFYTPPALVAGVLDLALDPVLARAAAAGADAVLALRVVDPACGDGRFLVAAGERLAHALEGLGLAADDARAAVAGRCLFGIDVDPAAVRLARAAVRSLGGEARSVARRIVVGDALADAHLLPAGSFDVVVGNPPFLSQLDAATARTAAASAALRQRFGDAVAAYTDPSAAFLLLGIELARPDGGAVALIEPVSMLTSRDAGGVRAAARHRAALRDLWVVGDGGFDAAVEVCVPVLERGARSTALGPTRLHRGVGRDGLGEVAGPAPTAASWSPLLAALDGLPERELRSTGTLADLATATADFRDQYYGLAPHVVDRADADDAALPPLVTVGLVDPGALHWGERPTRFNKVRYLHPRVELAALPEPLQPWAAARLVPKVLLATQTRVPEAVADPTGRLLPSVPMVSVVPHRPDDVWLVAAVLTCPAIALLAARRHLGSGRNARALRLRAAEVLALPLPADRAGWRTGARLLRAGAPLAEVGAAMDGAYGLADDPELLAWWLHRLPRR